MLSNTIEQKEKWNLVIQPKSGWLEINLKEIWRYRDLVTLFVRRDFVAVYKQTILGPFWYVIRPLLTTITFTIVFGRIANLSTDGVPDMLFYMAGIVCWSYFAECFNKTSDTFFNNAYIFGKVYFPRLVMPLSVSISNLFSFGIQFLFFICFLLYFQLSGAGLEINSHLLLTPLLVLIMAALGLGMGIIISAMTTKYRDMKFMIGFGIQLLMYASPVIYPLSSVEGKLRMVLLANPMTSVIETFKFGFLGVGSFSWGYLGYSAGFALLMLFTGIVVFNRVERTFMDTV